ncbi:ThiF family adenylyltransferase [Bdellovibrio reynosensis]|uniref:ThiF family adenylyltransferase n=1 Tax=Bdellovibrio reynosensis TaxID=2835041 RepID=A0ABY4CD42_9BACT|nr:ThiF family adenylyltransferase [Bdellovibrio reynosensis]UOF02887.1 ThiF family adenylyltransferase [Bdellovibrio reynosensis]
MSQQLINRSSDLKRLQDEGYEIEIRANHLLVKNVPYLTSRKEVRLGVLVSTLTLAGDKTTIPDDHQTHFQGEVPCHEDGSPNGKILNQSARRTLGNGVEIDHSFSARPKENGGRYLDYYDKITTYVAILEGPAQTVDPSATAKTFSVIPAETTSIFKYVDTASSRAAIGAVTDKLRTGKIGIIGLGGTGSYILDQIAKTPVDEIHLFDGDLFLQHNAFRSPGAPSIDTLLKKQNKAEYFGEIYSMMRNGIVVHPYEVNSTNLDHLKEMTFVFIAIDNGPAKRTIIEALEAWNIPFIDVGMGVYLAEDKVGGILRVTASSPAMRNHVHEKGRISFGAAHEENEYNRNIQIADLNALNGILAVIKWKKMMGFYLDFENEYFSTYTIDGNHLNNEDSDNEI